MKQKVKIDKAVVGRSRGRRSVGGRLVDDTLCQSEGDGVSKTFLPQDGTRQIDETSPNLKANERQNTSDPSAAGLIDGEIVVVCTEQESNGDASLAAHIIDAHSLDGTGDSDAGLVTEPSFSTGVDQEIAINVLAADTDPGLIVSHINGTPIATAAPVDVGSGWVQVRGDGLLTISPDVGYAGRISFDYTVTGADGRTYGGHATVYVKDNSASERSQHTVRRRGQRCLRVRVGLGFPRDQSGSPGSSDL